MKIRILFLILLCVSVSAELLAQSGGRNTSKTGTTAATFLEIPAGAAAIGMGGAFVSIANDPTALYWNVAGAASLQQTSAAMVRTNWLADTRFNYAALVVSLGDAGSIGFSFTSLSMDDMKVTTVEMPDGTGEYFSAGDIAFGISYARHLTDRFAVGMTMKYIQQNIWHESATGFGIDVGTTFRTDLFGGMVIGASLSNFGSSMQLSGRDLRQYIRLDESKEGSNDRIPTDIETDAWALPLTFQLGVSTTPLKTDLYRWTVAVDALHPSDNYESLNFGTELAVMDYIFLRGGYQSAFLQDVEGGLSLGVGLSSNLMFGRMRVNVDYAYQDRGRLKEVHTLMIGVSF